MHPSSPPALLSPILGYPSFPGLTTHKSSTLVIPKEEWEDEEEEEEEDEEEDEEDEEEEDEEEEEEEEEEYKRTSADSMS